MNIWKANEIAYAHILSRAWLNDDFMNRLLKNPSEVLQANGFTLPPNANVKMNAGGKTVKWDPATSTLDLPLPNRPANVQDAEILSQDADDGITLCTSCCCCA